MAPSASAARLTICEAMGTRRRPPAVRSILPEVRTVTSRAAKWTESILDFGGRITKPGVEATRLDNADRVKPTTGAIDISTVLLRAEVPVGEHAVHGVPSLVALGQALGVLGNVPRLKLPMNECELRSVVLEAE